MIRGPKPGPELCLIIQAPDVRMGMLPVVELLSYSMVTLAVLAATSGSPETDPILKKAVAATPKSDVLPAFTVIVPEALSTSHELFDPTMIPFCPKPALPMIEIPPPLVVADEISRVWSSIRIPSTPPQGFALPSNMMAFVEVLLDDLIIKFPVYSFGCSPVMIPKPSRLLFPIICTVPEPASIKVPVFPL